MGEKQKLEAKKKEEEKQKLEAKKIEEKQMLETKKKEEEKKKVEAKKKEEEKIRLDAKKAEEEKVLMEKKKVAETPPLGRMKRRTSSTEATSEHDPVSILKGGKGSRDNSKDRRPVSESEEVLPGKPLSRTGSIKKSSSFNKNKNLADKKKISFDEDVDAEPISQAKQLFAAIADTTLESGRQKLRDNSRDRVNEAFSRTEPAEWDPEENPDNEDELMIILDTPEV